MRQMLVQMFICFVWGSYSLTGTKKIINWKFKGPPENSSDLALLFFERQWKSLTEHITEQSDAGLTLTASLMKVNQDDWPSVYYDEVCHSADCWGDLSL